MRTRTVLVVEDDTAIRRGLMDVLEFEGFQTLEATDGHEGLEAALQADYDLLLLDLIMPGPDGFEILRQVRESRPTIPVIILTAKGEEGDRVRGLKLGADDYVLKPFSVKELMARVEAVLRRSPERPTDVSEVAVPGGVADLSRGRVCHVDGETFDLSEREQEVLRYLASHAGRVISRDELLARVWRIRSGRIETRTVDMHIARLREKLRDRNGQLLVTVRGKGYMFTRMANARV